MAQNVLRVDADRSGIGTQVDQGTARTALGLGQHAVSQCQRSQIHLGHIDACRLETLVEVLVERLALQDVQEVALNM